MNEEVSYKSDVKCIGFGINLQERSDTLGRQDKEAMPQATWLTTVLWLEHTALILSGRKLLHSPKSLVKTASDCKSYFKVQTVLCRSAKPKNNSILQVRKQDILTAASTCFTLANTVPCSADAQAVDILWMKGRPCRWGDTFLIAPHRGTVYCSASALSDTGL